MKQKRIYVYPNSFTWITLALFSYSAWAEIQTSPPPDKSGYHLLNPVPKDQMRKFNTDRPDKTESPFSVDAGHFQIEADLLSYVDDQNKESHTKTFNWAVLNLKAGLTNSTDFQFVIPTFVSQTQKTGGAESRDQGIGDITLRLKQNLIGNDHGEVSLGIMPFVTLTTAKAGVGNDKIEGGILLPIATSLPNGWELGIMFQFNKAKNDADDSYHSEWITTFTFSHDIAGKLGAYTEFFSQTNNEKGAEWIATFDTGFTYQIESNLQLDLGLNTGLTPAADDLNPFMGISARL